MIACIAKNSRGLLLFHALRAIDPAYTPLGAVAPSKISLIKGALLSISASKQRIKIGAYFSPVVRAELESCCDALLAQHSDVDAVLYWGATNFPMDRGKRNLPYFIITDGPYDPNDAGYPTEWRPGRWSREYFARQHAIYNQAAHVFTLSEWARRKVIEVHQVPSSHVTRIGWGPVHQWDAPILDRPAQPYFVSIGNHWYTKAMDVVAEAGARFHQTHPEFSTVIMGALGDLSLNPRPGVHLLPCLVPGPVAQTMIANAQALIVASRFDASPHVIYEALQCGTPVIGTNVCGIPEAIDAPRGGLVVPKEDCDAMVQAMHSIASSDALARRRQAYQSFVASGGWAESALKVHNVINRTAHFAAAAH